MTNLFNFINRIDDVPFSLILQREFNYKVAVFIGYLLKEMLINGTETVTIDNVRMSDALNMTITDIRRCKSILNECDFISYTKYLQNSPTSYTVNFDKLNEFLLQNKK
jgi:hypothetical protein